MTKVARWIKPGAATLSAAIAATLLTSCTSADGPPSASPPPTGKNPTATGQKKHDRRHDDDPNLLRGFRSWLKSHDSKRDDDLGDHVLSIRLRYDADRRAGRTDVLTDYGPWGSAEQEVAPLATAFQEWWDDDPSGDTATFRSQGGKSVKRVKLHTGGKPVNLLTDFRSWTTTHTQDARDAKNRADHITSLTIGYGKRASGAVTLSTDYLTRKDPKAQQHIDALARDFAAWWDGDKAADNVTVTSEDQGVHTERKLTAR